MQHLQTVFSLNACKAGLYIYDAEITKSSAKRALSRCYYLSAFHTHHHRKKLSFLIQESF